MNGRWIVKRWLEAKDRKQQRDRTGPTNSAKGAVETGIVPRTTRSNSRLSFLSCTPAGPSQRPLQGAVACQVPPFSPSVSCGSSSRFATCTSTSFASFRYNLLFAFSCCSLLIHCTLMLLFSSHLFLMPLCPSPSSVLRTGDDVLRGGKEAVVARRVADTLVFL